MFEPFGKDFQTLPLEHHLRRRGQAIESFGHRQATDKSQIASKMRRHAFANRKVLYGFVSIREVFLFRVRSSEPRTVNGFWSLKRRPRPREQEIFTEGNKNNEAACACQALLGRTRELGSSGPTQGGTVEQNSNNGVVQVITRYLLRASARQLQVLLVSNYHIPYWFDKNLISPTNLLCLAHLII